MENDHSSSGDLCGGTKSWPRILYMYRSLNDHLRDALIQKHLWASNPLSFNDPFDCSIPASNISTPAEATECVEYLLRQMEAPTPAFQAWVRNEASNGRIPFAEDFEKGWRKSLEKAGVVCFTERPDNLLMWAHYASQHGGLCLGFEGLSERLDLQRVQYAKTLPTLKLVDLLPPKDLEATKIRLTSKSCRWAYEREWRFILCETKFSSNSDPHRKVPFSPNELRRVIFGCRMPAERRQEVILLLKNWPTKIHFYEAVTHSSRFALNLRPIEI